MAALAFWLKAKTIIELFIFVLSIFGLGKTKSFMISCICSL